MAHRDPMRLTRRAFLSAGGGALLLATTGCGAATPSPTGTTSGQRSATPASRTVKHAMGETTVLANPRRVVVLDTGELDSALALGVTPVGSVTGREGSGFPAYLGDKTAGIKSVGSYEQPNLETIASLRPDLILSSKLRHEKIYDQLARIAPTVFTATVGVSWQENLRVHAEALGKDAEAARLLQDYEARAADFKRRMGERLATTRVSVVRALPDHIRVMMKATFAGTILRDAGLPRPPAQDKDIFMERVKTKEGIPLMDGDVIFVMHFIPEQDTGGSAGTLLQGWLGDPLWQNLSAVKAGRVYTVSDDTWARGIGIIGANRVLDDLFTYLAGSPAASTATPTASRTVKHAMGETKAPADPRRVVVLDTGELDSALALGVKPVGAVTVFPDGDFQAYLKPKAAGIKQVGAIEQPNLEAIAALRPDLILSSKLRHEKIYDQLARIAPTIFTESVGVTWKANFQLHAEALGKSAEAERLMVAYRGRLEEFQAKIGPRREQTRVSILRSFPDHVRIYMKASFIGTVLQDASLPRPPAQDQDKFAERVTTKEGIPAMDGDVIFVLHFSPDKGSLLKDWMNDPLWKNLKAVQQGRVYEAPDDTWALGIGILAANEVVDDLFEYLVQ